MILRHLDLATLLQLGEWTARACGVETSFAMARWDNVLGPSGLCLNRH